MDCLEITAAPSSATVYYAFATNANGCEAMDSSVIHVKINSNLYVPNAFSPNYDGINDMFYIYGDESVEKVLSLVIFDRWGDMVFESYNFPINDPVYGWDGTFKGKMMVAGVFVWVTEIEFKNGRVELHEGELTLIR